MKQEDIKEKQEKKWFAVAVAMLCTLALCTIGIIVVLWEWPNIKNAAVREHYDEVSAKYEIMLNGVKVDADDIDVDCYKIKIDDEAGKVLLATK